MSNINELRKQMDDVNSRMIDLFAERMEISAQIADYKKENGLPVYDPERERAILTAVSEQAQGGLEGYARVLFQTLFDVSRSWQETRDGSAGAFGAAVEAAKESTPALFPQRALVACQGVEGAYSQLACSKIFSAPSILYAKNFDGVFQMVQKGLCQFGILPIENSSYGSVTAVYDLMKDHHFHIVRSLRLHIDHCLLVKPGTKPENIREIVSHGQAIGQCAGFLASMPGVKITACENTAEAAKLVAQSPRDDIASISSHNCAALYGLESIRDHIQDRENNYTRFICITRDLQVYPGANRMSMMFTLPHRPGSLYRMIAKFAALGLNITKLESRPIAGRDFEFMFYLDVEASLWQPEVVTLLGELAASGEYFSFLGNYSEV